jgi:hypothetical protein
LAVLQLGEVRYDDLFDLACSPQLARLRALVLHVDSIAEIGLMAQSASLAPQREVYFFPGREGTAARIEDRVSEALAAVDSECCRLLVQPIRENVSVPQLRTLLSSLPASTLTALGFENMKRGPDLAHVLGNEPRLTGLRSLHLADNSLGNSGAKVLASSPHLGDLRFLDLTGNGLTPRGIALVRERFGEGVVC